jgi:hypothetical protein
MPQLFMYKGQRRIKDIRQIPGDYGSIREEDFPIEEKGVEEQSNRNSKTRLAYKGADGP